jgi:hypothetical protein
MDLWKGQGPIQLSLIEEKYTDNTGALDFSEGDLLPLKLRVEVQNTSASPIQIHGLFIDVEKSASENKPAIQMRINSSLNCHGDPRYSPAFIMENLGWSSAENAVLKFASDSAASNGQPSGFPASKNLGTFDKAVIVDFEPELKASGVDTEFLQSIGKEGFVCKSKTPTQCLKDFRATGKLGTLASRVQVHGKRFFLNFSSTLEYSWKDAAGVDQAWKNQFTAIMPIGFVRREENCGAEGGAPQLITTKTQQLKADGVAYKIAISYQTAISPGRSVPLLFAVNAPKSSMHDFSVVLQLSDGREIRSRPINLLYYRPRWDPEELPSGPLEPPDQPNDESVIQPLPQKVQPEWLSHQELVGSNLRQIKRSEAYLCLPICDAEPACKGWSYDSRDHKCNLKKSAESLRFDSQFSSGLKIGTPKPVTSSAPITIAHLQRKTLSGYNYLVDLLTTRDECEHHCEGDEGRCVGFIFKTKTAECYLMGSIQSIRSSNDSESGIKQQISK